MSGEGQETTLASVPAIPAMGGSVGTGRNTADAEPATTADTATSTRVAVPAVRTQGQEREVAATDEEEAAAEVDIRSEAEIKQAKLDYFSTQCSEIIPGFLFVAGQAVAEDLTVLRAHGITHVLNAAAPHCSNYHEETAELQYLALPMYDSKQEDLSWFVHQAIEFIEAARLAGEGSRVLVHCVQGVSRSVALAIAYLMWSRRTRFKETFDAVKALRGIAAPNVAFMCNLLEWEKALFEEEGGSLPARAWFLGRHATYDAETRVLKQCRDMQNRALIVPSLRSLEQLDTCVCLVLAFPAAPATANVGEESVQKPAARPSKSDGDEDSGDPAQEELRPAESVSGSASARNIPTIAEAPQFAHRLPAAASTAPTNSEQRDAPSSLHIWVSEKCVEEDPDAVALAQQLAQRMWRVSNCHPAQEHAPLPVVHSVQRQETEELKRLLQQRPDDESMDNAFAALVAADAEIHATATTTGGQGSTATAAPTGAADSMSLAIPVSTNGSISDVGDGTNGVNTDGAESPVKVASPQHQQERTGEEAELEGRVALYCMRQAEDGNWEWHAMGVYDDDDLHDEDMLCLVAKPDVYFWLGSDAQEAHGGDGELWHTIASASSGDCPVGELLQRGAQAMIDQSTTTVVVDGCTFSVSLQHEESDAFWDAFERGY